MKYVEIKKKNPNSIILYYRIELHINCNLISCHFFKFIMKQMEYIFRTLKISIHDIVKARGKTIKRSLGLYMDTKR